MGTARHRKTWTAALLLPTWLLCGRPFLLRAGIPDLLPVAARGQGPRATAQTWPLGPRELYQALNALRVDADHVYYVKDLHIRRDAVRVSLVEGKLAFLSAYNGRLTGAVFSGQGHVLAVPRDPAERRSLAHFLKAPLLDQGFSRAYFRFTDNAGDELLRQLQESGAPPTNEPGFAEDWNGTVANLNPWHSLRILMDWLATEPRPYFYGGLIGDASGAFDVLVDDRRPEQVLLGQPRWVAGEFYYDVWTSFRRSDAPGFTGPPFAAVAYSIETSIHADRSLEGATTLALKALRGGERVVALELSRFLSVRSAEDSSGRPLVYFQNEAVNRHEIAQRGNDSLLVVLPAAANAGDELRLRIAYKGNVISDAGNGVYFVGDRGSWYPHIGGTANFAQFEMTFRWPRRLQLVATGKKLEEGEEEDSRVSRWRSETPVPTAGFNLGDYVTHTVDAGAFKVELYANKQLERAVAERYRRPIAAPLPPISEKRPRASLPTVSLMDAPPSPAEVLNRLSQEIAAAAHFFERLNGPFPFENLAVSQIPGTFGQGWPGLLYISTLSFLSPEAQHRAGISERAQEHFTQIVPYHEVAHQWWGNVVGWESYRDQWIEEGLANYIALLYADTRKAPDRTLAAWLERYRRDLTSKQPGQDEPAENAGSLALGYRLQSSKSRDAYNAVIYGKGTWVFHMLRMMLREPAAKDPDAQFAQLLQRLLESHRYGALSTEDLQHAVEKLMTPAMALEGGHSMDWFFDQWVRGSGVPHYSVQFTVRPQGDGFAVRGVLKQTGVPESFMAPVPLYATRPGSKPALLGTVVTSGEETSFHFTSRMHPKRILIDPQLTLLCLTE